MFRKQRDEGLAGDNVGVLLRGIQRDEIERGQVIAKQVQSIHTKFKGRSHILTKRRRWTSHSILQQLPPTILLPVLLTLQVQSNFQQVLKW